MHVFKMVCFPVLPLAGGTLIMEEFGLGTIGAQEQLAMVEEQRWVKGNEFYTLGTMEAMT